MIGVIANIKIKNRFNKDFEEVAKKLVKEVNAKEKENIFYRLYKKSDNEYIMMEGYISKSGLEEHTLSSHYKKYGKAMARFLDGRPEVKVYEEIAPGTKNWL